MHSKIGDLYHIGRRTGLPSPSFYYFSSIFAFQSLPLMMPTAASLDKLNASRAWAICKRPSQ